MNGVINIWKEKGYSSFHAVYMLRRLTGEQKVGHTGTLDPDVTGVLPVCIGKATKLVGQLTDTDKTYRCRMLLGRMTDTQDISGQVLREMPEDEVRRRIVEAAEVMQSGTAKAIAKDAQKADEVTVEETLAAEGSQVNASGAVADFLSCCEYISRTIRSFEGEISQIPPMYSALKVNGAKLVNLARKGVEVERKPRKIRIHSITEIEVSPDLRHISFLVHCSRGTYVRTLCEDIGAQMGIPACMEELERTQAAGLGRESAITLEQAMAFADQGTLDEHVIPTDHFLQIYPAIVVKESAVRRLIYGNYMMPEDLANGPAKESQLAAEDRLASPQNTEHSKAPLPENGFAREDLFRVYDETGQFYALYRFDSRANCYKCVKMFVDAE